jgi:hypothetical protein
LNVTDLSAINEIANGITVIALLLFILLALAKGWLITSGRYDDCIVENKRLEKDNDELQSNILAINKKYDRLIIGILSSGAVLPIMIMFYIWIHFQLRGNKSNEQC